MNIDAIKVAQLFATQAHQGQLYGFLPFTHHLAEVHGWLVEFGCDDQELLVASWLHDTIEDTNTKRKGIQELFGERVADLVWAVTDGPGANRAERKAGVYQKIKGTPGATMLKLADRVANVRHGGALVDMYIKEHSTFKEELYVSGQHEDMWEWLSIEFSNSPGEVRRLRRRGATVARDLEW